MKMWKRAAGALKDQKSILLATILTPRSPSRNGTLEAAIIKATSHNGEKLDNRSVERVLDWIRRSPESLKPLIWGLSLRMERTQSWVVALKGLMLMHGILCSNTPTVLRIGRLPFDLSNFTDGHSSPSKMWGFNAFVRAYFTFLDHRSALLYPPTSSIKKCKRNTASWSVGEEEEYEEEELKLVVWEDELVKVEKWEALLELLLKIKPLADTMRGSPLIVEAMDCITIEIFDLYTKICRGATRVLQKAGMAAGKPAGKAARKAAVSATTLHVLEKARALDKSLALYLDFCQAFDVKVLHHMVTGVSDLQHMVAKRGGHYFCKSTAIRDTEDDQVKAAVIDKEVIIIGSNNARLQTVITHKWEVFDEDHHHDPNYNYNYNYNYDPNYNYNDNHGDHDQQLVSPSDVGSLPSMNPFEMHHDQLQVVDLLSFLPSPNQHHHLHHHHVYKQEDVPDLISF